MSGFAHLLIKLIGQPRGDDCSLTVTQCGKCIQRRRSERNAIASRVTSFTDGPKVGYDKKLKCKKVKYGSKLALRMRVSIITTG
jgi:hypothetical protein